MVGRIAVAVEATVVDLCLKFPFVLEIEYRSHDIVQDR